jgi:hypothetical protein
VTPFPTAVSFAECVRLASRHRVQAEGRALSIQLTYRLIKVKTEQWKAANLYRAKLFAKE